MNVEIKKTADKGKGVFALKDFKKSDLIFPITGRIIREGDALNLSYYHLNHMSAISKTEWILVNPPMKFVNHSCEPNVYEKNQSVYAMNDIAKGEELVFDYAINGLDSDDWRMSCKCNSQNCRKNIKGSFFALPLNLQKKYVPFLDDWFAKEFEDRVEKLFDSQ